MAIEPRRSELVKKKPLPDATPLRKGFYLRRGKRMFDVLFALAILPLILPIMAVIYVGMLHQGNVFFVQERVGQNGKSFRCYKFRTMRVGAETILAELCDTDYEVAEEWCLNQKLAHDPRVTRLGKTLRKSRLDELPQIINILLGQMSFVGSRPFLPSQRAAYNAAGGEKYYDGKPGVTGSWQVFQGENSVFAERASFDNLYFRDISFGTDIKIIFITIYVALKFNGK